MQSLQLCSIHQKMAEIIMLAASTAEWFPHKSVSSKDEHPANLTPVKTCILLKQVAIIPCQA